MKKLALIVSLLLVSTIFQACTISGGRPLKYNYATRFGPVQLKVDGDWELTKDDVRFIRIGIKKHEMFAIDFEYKGLSPESLAINTSETVLKSDKKDGCFPFKIVYYDIPVGQTELWIDLHLFLMSSYKEGSNDIKTFIPNLQGFYIYHPQREKWWGVYNQMNFENIMFEELYDQKLNTVQEFKEFWENSREDSNYVNPNSGPINKRVLRIPSLKVYEENLSVLVNEYKWFSWFAGKKDDQTKPVQD